MHLTTEPGSELHFYDFETVAPCRLHVDYEKPCYKMVFCFEGWSESYLGSSRLYAFKEGRALFYRSESATYRSRLKQNTPFRIVHLHLSDQTVEEYRKIAHRLFSGEVIEISLPPQSFNLLNLGRDFSQCRNELVDLFLETIVMEQLYGFYNSLVGWRDQRENAQHSDIKKVMDAKELLDSSRKYLKIREVSRKVGLNTFKLKKLFKSELNQTIFEYQVTRHLTKAYTLLLETDSTVEEIALKCGYESTGSFSNAFKRKFGVRPSEVKKS